MAKVESNEGNILQKGVQLNFNKRYSFTSRPYDQIKLNININRNRSEQKIAYLLVLVLLVLVLVLVLLVRMVLVLLVLVRMVQFHRGFLPVDVRLMKQAHKAR